jgi:hypothetical protein
MEVPQSHLLGWWCSGDSRCETLQPLKSAGGIRGEEVLDRRELPDTLGCPGRALIVELILVRLTVLGVSFGLLAFESREMAANFIGRKHTSHFGDNEEAPWRKPDAQ